MEKKQLLLAIERLNYEKSEIYEMNKSSHNHKKKIVDCLRHPIKCLKHHIAIKECSKYDEIPLAGSEVLRLFEETSEKKLVIYTCVTGKYDSVCDPLIWDSNIEYYLFTDEIDFYSNYLRVWQVKTIPFDLREKYSNSMINRYIKMHPFELFENDFDFAMYIDGNVRIVSDAMSLMCNTNNITGLAFHRHRQRKNIQKEAEVCKLLKKGNSKYLDNQIRNYIELGYPLNFGMYEATVFGVDLKNTNANKIMSEWWDEFVKSKSMRDQIALPFSVWKFGYRYNDIGNLGDDLYQNYVFEVKKHI